MASTQPRLPQVILPVQDLTAAAAFYRDALGMAVESLDAAAGTAVVRGPGGVQLVLAAAGAELAPWPGVKVAGPRAWVYLHRPDVAALAAELAGRGVCGVGPREPYPGMRHLQVTDPDGYVVEFWESVPLADAAILELYRTGPAHLQAALAGLTEADLALPRAPGKWTIRQIVHHIADSDVGTFHVLRMAMAESGRTVNPNLWDPDGVAIGLDYANRPIEPAVALFAAAREWVLSAVAHLPGALDRYVVWPSGYRSVVREMLQQVGGHAMHHILQIRETRQLHGR